MYPRTKNDITTKFWLIVILALSVLLAGPYIFHALLAGFIQLLMYLSIPIIIYKCIQHYQNVDNYNEYEY